MKKRKNTAKHDYFDNIDTELKAYFLGLIYADGAIVSNKNRQKQLIISLQEDDGYILETLCNEITPQRKITIANPPSVIKNNWKKRAVYKVSSDQICDSLIKLGCGPRKSIVGMQFPVLKKELIPHFIRGFFDGDGCIYNKVVSNTYVRKTAYILKNPFKPKYQRRIVIGCTDKIFMKTIEKYLSLYGISKFYWQSRVRTNRIYILNIERQQDVQKFYDYIYQNASLYFKRKYEKFSKTISSQAIDTSIEGSETT